MTATVRGISVEDRGGSIGEVSDEYTVTYKVVTDDRLDGSREAMTATGIPQVGSIYQAGNDFDPTAVVTNISADQGDSPWEWDVEVTFSNATTEQSDPQEQIDNPLNKPVQITYGFTNRRILVPGAYNDPNSPPFDHLFDLGIFAPNGELFNPQPEVDISEPLVTFTKNVSAISGSGLMSLADTVNSDNFQGAEPRQLRLLAPQATKQYHNTVGVYWTVTYQMAFRWSTWDLQVLNQGSFYWDGGKPADISTVNTKVKRDEVGTPIIVNLTTDGDINTTDTPTFTVLRFYREIPFSNLGIF